MKGSIICIGNRFVDEDAAGLLVFERLQAMQPLPHALQLIEGGLAGLNLLPLLEQGGRVVFIDAVRGYTAAGEIVVLDQQEILCAENQPHYDHAAGLAYVLTVLPKVCDGDLPEEIFLLGLEGACTTQTIDRAAAMSLAVAAHGLKGLG